MCLSGVISVSQPSTSLSRASHQCCGHFYVTIFLALPREDDVLIFKYSKILQTENTASNDLQIRMI